MPSDIEKPVRVRHQWATRSLVEHVTVGTAGLVWLLVLNSASGGFHDPRTAVVAVMALPALLACRPWCTVGPFVLWAVGAAGAGALLVLLTTAPGWVQADSPASQMVGLLALVVVAGYARTPSRRLAVVVFLMFALLVQFAQAWLPWWGSGDPNHLMVAPYYWHNQLAASLGALALLAGAIAVLGNQPLRRPCLLLTPLAVAVVVLTTARSALALLVLGWLAIVVISARQPRRLVVALALPLLSAVAVAALTSAYFFPDRSYDGPPVLHESASTGAVAGERGSASADDNGADRLRWTGSALSSFRDAPIRGHGFGSFIDTSSDNLPEDALLSRFVHNGPAEALTSGGLVFGGPLLLIIGWVAIQAIRPKRDANDERGPLLGASLAVLYLIGHSLVDFDWHYASLVIQLGILGGLLLGRHRARAATPLVLLGLVLAIGVATAGALVEHELRTQSRAAAAAPGT